MPYGEAFPRGLAGGGDLAGYADAAARSIQQRLLSGSLSQHRTGNGRGLRRLDAALLRGGAGRRVAIRPIRGRSCVITRPHLLAGEKGYEATSIEEIAARAHLAIGTFYQHYRSKRQLVLALMDDLLEKLGRVNLGAEPVNHVRA